MIEHYSAKVANLFHLAAQKTGNRCHLARQKMIFALIMSLIETRSVHFGELATKLNASVQDESNLRRIQAFFAHYILDYDLIAMMLLSAVGIGKYRISIDRTNWLVGQQSINVLTLTIYAQGVGLPIFFELLDKEGNSNAQERIDLLERFINLLGKERILSVTADREFVGRKWLKWLIDNKITFAIRFPKSHHLTLRNGETYAPADLLTHQCERYFERVLLDGVRVNVALKKLEGDYLLVAGTLPPKKLFRHYRYRWSIECFFQSLKKRGFHLEDTHLNSLERIKKLLALVSLAFVVCWQVGYYYHCHRSAIPIKTHGYKAKSFFRKGLDLIRRACKFIERRADLLAHYLSWLGKNPAQTFV